ncbi:hypothetical protein [Lapidilactobacillus gannanensis]|jgi:hypothetical protein|uniref:DUF1659 domain-containing protein n=1 Tax=Lapidilactobacillus gannanensis TaxID=2486002 RepID=A0ABW4BKC1_9LACO|nr:hypothetical protein [Lapidilactobacillus gannanensis]MCH4058126.1 hypothetical protein [Lactobacillaceae bacterium]
MATSWQATTIALEMKGEHYEDGVMLRRFNKIVEAPTTAQLQTLGRAMAKLGVADHLGDAEVTVKQLVSFDDEEGAE